MYEWLAIGIPYHLIALFVKDNTYFYHVITKNDLIIAEISKILTIYPKKCFIDFIYLFNSCEITSFQYIIWQTLWHVMIAMYVNK